MGLSILTNYKKNNCNSILVIIDWFIKMIYYKPVKVIINILSLIKPIINIIIRHYNFSNLIFFNKKSFFNSKFQSSLYYFLNIKWKLSTTFYFQLNSLIKRQNNIIKAYFQAFVNFNQNNKARFLLIAKFVYNNPKMLALITHFLSLIINIIFVFFMRKTLILNKSWKLLKNDFLSFEIE